MNRPKSVCLAGFGLLVATAEVGLSGSLGGFRLTREMLHLGRLDRKRIGCVVGLRAWSENWGVSLLHTGYVRSASVSFPSTGSMSRERVFSPTKRVLMVGLGQIHSVPPCPQRQQSFGQ